MKTKLFVAALLSVAFFSCSKKVTAPVVNTEVKVTEEVKTELPTAIAEGKTLYENSCARCHKLFPVTKHDKSGWAVTVDRMAPKAKLTAEQKDLVYNYLT
ncbi:cytochrome c [Flavobacterium amnicola]|uniref:Cytochrome c n=1 Tax=Flavobacterium amnicola TaxID=2506422 RepID=A0A4Q1K451_9FLAO|nr:cytochrome c [Flavobacterium amnicola]RXR19382.1 cytochrome c [Flavobacterium amnicola]